MNRRELIVGGGASLLTLALPADAAHVRWPNGHAGAISLTYDDGLASQLDVALPALEARRLRATFYVAMINMRRRLADWARVPARGHELGNHTIHHYCGLQDFAPEAFVAREILPMEAWLDRVASPARIRTFAYPCDVTNLGRGDSNREARRYAHLLEAQGIVAARTSQGAPNRPKTALHRPHRLQALAVGYDAPTAEAVLAYAQDAARQGYWAILIFHDIVPAVTDIGQVSVDMHTRILDGVGGLPLWCAPLGTVFTHIRQQSETRRRG